MHALVWNGIHHKLEAVIGVNPQVEAVIQIPRTDEIGDLPEVGRVMVEADRQTGAAIVDRPPRSEKGRQFSTFDVHLDEIG